MNFFNKIIYIVPNEFKRNFIFLLLLMVIGMIFEILGLGIVIPILGLVLTPDISVDYPQLKPLLEFLNNPTQKELILGGIITLISVYVIKSIFIIFRYYFIFYNIIPVSYIIHPSRHVFFSICSLLR